MQSETNTLIPVRSVERPTTKLKSSETIKSQPNSLTTIFLHSLTAFELFISVCADDLSVRVKPAKRQTKTTETDKPQTRAACTQRYLQKVAIYRAYPTSTEVLS